LFEVVAKAVYLLNFTLDRLRARLQFGFFQGCGAVVKIHSSGSGALLFMNMAPATECLVFMSMFSAFVRFYTLIF